MIVVELKEEDGAVLVADSLERKVEYGVVGSQLHVGTYHAWNSTFSCHNPASAGHCQVRAPHPPRRGGHGASCTPAPRCGS